MGHEPQDRISQIPETSDKPWLSFLRHFVGAWGWGMLSGLAALVVGTPFIRPATWNLYEVAIFTFSMGVFVGIFALGGMLMIGLPLTVLLRAIGKENAAIYAALGFIAGFLIIAIISDFPRHSNREDLLFFAAGTIAGLAAAFRWGRWRQQRWAALAQPPSKKRTNPIHDLIH